MWCWVRAIRVVDVRILVAITLLALLVPASSIARDAIRLRIGKDTLGFHIPLDLQGKTIIGRQPENEHWWMFVEDILDIFHRERDILVLESSVRNAYAMLRTGNDGQPLRIIVMDPTFQFARGDLGALAYRFVLAHEVGHHVCRHLVGRLNGLLWDKELEADRFAGAAMRRWLGGDKAFGLSELLAGVSLSLPPIGSASHPPIEKRLVAVAEGWNDGPPCME